MDEFLQVDGAALVGVPQVEDLGLHIQVSDLHGIKHAAEALLVQHLLAGFRHHSGVLLKQRIQLNGIRGFVQAFKVVLMENVSCGWARDSMAGRERRCNASNSPRACSSGGRLESLVSVKASL